MTLTRSAQRIRRTGYGSSEVATIVGMNPWQSPIKVYDRKVLEEEGGRASLPADLGVMLEEPVAKKYATRTGRHLRRVQTLTHPELAIVKATPDRAVFELPPAFSKAKKLGLEDLAAAAGLLEVKTVDEKDRRDYGEPGSDLIPEDKLVQTLWQLGATGKPWCDVAVLFGRREWEIFRVNANAEAFGNLYELVAKFDRDHVQARKPPPVDGSSDFKNFLAKLHPRPKPELGQLPCPAELVPAVETFLKLRAFERRLKVAIAREKNLLRQAIGDHLGLVHPELGAINLPIRAGTAKVDYAAVARELLMTCGLVLMTLSPKDPKRSQLEAQVSAIISRHTSREADYRWFQCKVTKGSAGDFDSLAVLDVGLAHVQHAGEGSLVLEVEKAEEQSHSQHPEVET